MLAQDHAGGKGVAVVGMAHRSSLPGAAVTGGASLADDGHARTVGAHATTSAAPSYVLRVTHRRRAGCKSIAPRASCDRTNPPCSEESPPIMCRLTHAGRRAKAGAPAHQPVRRAHRRRRMLGWRKQWRSVRYGRDRKMHRYLRAFIDGADERQVTDRPGLSIWG